MESNHDDTILNGMIGGRFSPPEALADSRLYFLQICGVLGNPGRRGNGSYSALLYINNKFFLTLLSKSIEKTPATPSTLLKLSYLLGGVMVD